MTSTPPSKHEIFWKTPPQQLILSPNHVHIWKASLSPSESQLARLQNLLATDEQIRAKRFKFLKHRRAFITARGVLRLILSQYLQIAPQSLHFGQGPHGKPFLISPTIPQLSFNVSHSHNIALYAVTLESHIGIDIEYHRKKLGVQSLIQRICSTEEKAILMALSPPEQKKGFFACWTRKEAYVKATGKGITIPLASLTVSLPPVKFVGLQQTESDEEDISHWAMSELPVGPSYTAAFAIKKINCVTSYWAWSWETFAHA